MAYGQAAPREKERAILPRSLLTVARSRYAVLAPNYGNVAPRGASHAGVARFSSLTPRRHSPRPQDYAPQNRSTRSAHLAGVGVRSRVPPQNLHHFLNPETVAAAKTKKQNPRNCS